MGKRFLRRRGCPRKLKERSKHWGWGVEKGSPSVHKVPFVRVSSWQHKVASIPKGLREVKCGDGDKDYFYTRKVLGPWKYAPSKMRPIAKLCNVQNLSLSDCQLVLNSHFIIWKRSLILHQRALFRSFKHSREGSHWLGLGHLLIFKPITMALTMQCSNWSGLCHVLINLFP